MFLPCVPRAGVECTLYVCACKICDQYPYNLEWTFVRVICDQYDLEWMFVHVYADDFNTVHVWVYVHMLCTFMGGWSLVFCC